MRKRPTCSCGLIGKNGEHRRMYFPVGKCRMNIKEQNWREKGPTKRQPNGLTPETSGKRRTEVHAISYRDAKRVKKCLKGGNHEAILSLSFALWGKLCTGSNSSEKSGNYSDENWIQTQWCDQQWVKVFIPFFLWLRPQKVFPDQILIFEYMYFTCSKLSPQTLYCHENRSIRLIALEHHNTRCSQWNNSRGLFSPHFIHPLYIYRVNKTTEFEKWCTFCVWIVDRRLGRACGAKGYREVYWMERGFMPYEEENYPARTPHSRGMGGDTGVGSVVLYHTETSSYEFPAPFFSCYISIDVAFSFFFSAPKVSPRFESNQLNSPRSAIRSFLIWAETRKNHNGKWTISPPC